MPGGRPPIFDTAEDLQSEIDRYFRDNEPITITGLAFYLGFESRQSLYDYEKKEEYSYIIKRARLQVEISYEERLDSKNPTGAIFALKNMGWKDKHEVEQSGGIKIGFADPGDYVYPSQDQSDSGIPESL